jgi:hypothetical protein
MKHDNLTADRIPGSLHPAGSAENVSLPNDTKIRFCNAFDQIKAHTILCKECDMYLRWGDGDLCSAGKTIIAMEMCYTDTHVEFPPNDQAQRPLADSDAGRKET